MSHKAQVGVALATALAVLCCAAPSIWLLLASGGVRLDTLGDVVLGVSVFGITFVLTILARVSGRLTE